MKWDRALSALMIIFILINSFLGIANYTKYIAVYQVDDGQINQVKSLLETRGITVSGSIPRSFRPVETILLKPRAITNEERNDLVERLLDDEEEDIIISKKASEGPYDQVANLYRQGDKLLTFKANYFSYEDAAISEVAGEVDKEETLIRVEQFLEERMGPYLFEKSKIDYRIESYGAVVTYYELYGGLPVFDRYITVRVTKEGIAKVEMNQVAITQREQTTRAIMPIDEILFSIQQYISKEAPYTIESIELGYSSMRDEDMLYLLEEEAIPVYKINIQGLEDIIFVNAYIK